MGSLEQGRDLDSCRSNHEQIFSGTRSYWARCQSGSRLRNTGMSSLDPHSVLLGFVLAYLHVSISSHDILMVLPKKFSSAASKILQGFSQRRFPKTARMVMVPFFSLSKQLMWVCTVSLTTGKGTASATVIISNHKQFRKHGTMPDPNITGRKRSRTYTSKGK